MPKTKTMLLVPNKEVSIFRAMGRTKREAKRSQHNDIHKCRYCIISLEFCG